MENWLVVSTPLKNISQLGLLFPIYGKIKNVPNHQQDGNQHNVENMMIIHSILQYTNFRANSDVGCSLASFVYQAGTCPGTERHLGRSYIMKLFLGVLRTNNTLW
jgi:hypothetical protein